jgi:hypothetical protein
VGPALGGWGQALAFAAAADYIDAVLASQQRPDAQA